jgi:hypothetical protein
MVPFYGQGMNCGFQDVLELDKVSNIVFVFVVFFPPILS